MRVLLVALLLAGCMASPAEPLPLWAVPEVHVAIHAVPGATVSAASWAHLEQQLEALLAVEVTIAPVQPMAPLPAADGEAIYARHLETAPDADLHVLVLGATPEPGALVWVLHDAPVVVLGHDVIKATASATQQLAAPATAPELERAALLHGIGHAIGLSPCDEAPWCERDDMASVMTWQVANRLGRLEAAAHGIGLPDTFDAADRDALARIRSG